jgi:dihydrofolate synthase/folylpolyglutamate synthase
MTYEEALAYWYGRINYEVRAPQPGDLKLDRMRGLLGHLGDPQRRVRAVHVAGSKGKGSTAAMLAATLQHAGYRTGLFTSPHLSHVEERIQINGATITADELTSLMAEIRDAVTTFEAKNSGEGDAPTFFEIVTALGFLHFVRRRVEVAVLEVGLGGRFDSTNVCTPLVSVITSISLDHTRQLGSTLDRIAAEKAGIIRPGVRVVSGVRGADARRVIEATAEAQRAPLWALDRDFSYVHEPAHVTADGLQRPRVQITTPRHAWPWLELGLVGEHQAANAAVAVTALEALRGEGLSIPDAAVAAGLAQVLWPARMEVVARSPMIVLDCAHNVASVEALVATLETSFTPKTQRLVFAASNDKDLPGMLAVLGPRFRHVYLTRFTTSPRSADPAPLADLLKQAHVPCSVHSSPSDALATARRDSSSDDLICVTGSVFLAGELRTEILRHSD